MSNACKSIKEPPAQNQSGLKHTKVKMRFVKSSGFLSLDVDPKNQITQISM